jgi:hypothetical protein
LIVALKGQNISGMFGPSGRLRSPITKPRAALRYALGCNVEARWAKEQRTTCFVLELADPLTDPVADPFLIPFVFD